MKQIYYVFNNGQLKRKDNSVQFISENSTKRPIPIETISDFYIFGEVSCNTKFINFIAKNKISIHWFNYYGFYSGSFYPRETLLSGALLIEQVRHYNDNTKRLKIAKDFIDAASYNIYRNIRYYNERGKELGGFMQSIEYLRNEIPKCGNIKQLMGVEGNIRKVYYTAWNTIINQDIGFFKRVKNPPDNLINTLISFINTLVYTRVLSELYKTQLNPTVSYLHEPGTRRFSLSLDLAEIFKPILGDRLIFSLLNKNQITDKSFEDGLNFLTLKEKTIKLIINEFDIRLKRTIRHKELKRDVSYSHLIRLEAYKLVKHLIGEKEYIPFKMWW
jgi:CRISPR-associated protein Cas1